MSHRGARFACDFDQPRNLAKTSRSSSVTEPAHRIRTIFPAPVVITGTEQRGLAAFVVESRAAMGGDARGQKTAFKMAAVRLAAVGAQRYVRRRRLWRLVAFEKSESGQASRILTNQANRSNDVIEEFQRLWEGYESPILRIDSNNSMLEEPLRVSEP